MRFPEDNKIIFGQDHGWWYGVPSDIDFELDHITDQGMWLKGPSYGGKPYGNGGILVFFKQHQPKPEEKPKGPFPLK